MNRLVAAAATFLAILVALAAWHAYRSLSRYRPMLMPIDAPAKLATWPWQNALREETHPGVTHWLDRSSADGTVLDLFEFDFRRNPHLEFLLFDQDQDGVHPFRNRVRFWSRGVAAITRKLNGEGQGVVVAATNGLFFGFSRAGEAGLASHVAPVVVHGVPHFFDGRNPRWTFGVRTGSRGLEFDQEASPSVRRLKRFAYASGGAESLVREGKLAPLPPGSVNHSIAFDRMRTTRVGLAWTRDSGKLYLLFVKEPDAEGPSLMAASHGIGMGGGWSVPDMARFFVALGVWGAINSDAGDAGQLIYRTPGGRYELVPAKWASDEMRLTLDSDFSNASAGGTLMYWVVRDRFTRGEPEHADVAQRGAPP